MRRLSFTIAAAVLCAAPLAANAASCTRSSVANDWPNPTIVQFDTGKTAIKPEYRPQLAQTAKLAKDHYIQQVCVTGFADKQGDAAANLKLSRARAEAVAAELRKQGVDPRTIMIEAGGEPGGQIGSAFNRSATSDRRVEVRFTR